ncbi:helix-turn-helix transcriptional regulator [Effusibacillus consociatus]|uniref:Helix-turn-helix transcriptional regulator n=1 Tax=Effusibacillus consociatus TaxID=1117041 RepID=A0ABV9Q437_9BACL
MAAHQENQLTQELFDQLVSEKLKLIRVEADVTQDRMGEMIGISKKTLVQVEKGRQTLGFTGAALVALLFRNGEIMQSLFGESVVEIIDLVASNGKSKVWYKTMGGKVWWTEVRRSGDFIVQKHIVTGHHRIIDQNWYLHYYSLNPVEALKRLKELEK